jgi:ferric-dicitrate binding protein FerR (iron transport regulator)
LDNGIENIDDLIGKYLAGEATPQESAILEVWMRESESNRKYVDQFRLIFEKASAVKELQNFDTDAAWNKVKSNLKKKNVKSVRLDPSPSYAFWWRVAASIIVVIGVGFFLYKNMTPEEIVKPVEVVAEDKTVGDTLPDGSGVFLNKETKVAYAYNKKDKKHEVKLAGEAYFNVKHDKDETFIIDAQGIYIRDIGTSFNVKAYPESNTVEVLVEEGEVIFYTNDNPGIHLHANGKGIYNKVTKTFTIDEPEANVLAYKTKLFIFSGTDLKTVVESLNGVYDKKIIIDKRIENCQLTVSFREETLDEIVQVIAETLGLTYTESGGSFMLEGEGCE